MATLGYNDLLKRDNITVFTDRVNGKGGFQLGDDKSPPYEATGKVLVTSGNKVSMFDGDFTAASLSTFLSSKTGADRLEIELRKGNSRRFHLITKLYKDREFGGVASKSSGAGSERQELGLIKALNEAAARHEKPFIRQIGSNSFIKEASKNEGLSAVGQEPYIDVYIETTRGKFGISCKGESAPSLAGGGVAGLKVIAPDLLKKLYDAIERYLKNELKLKTGEVVPADSIPDLFVEIPQRYVELILRGNSRMGGPIDFMYVGKMDVVSDIESPEIKLNGNFFSIADYMRKIGKFYFRIRKRDIEPTNTVAIELQRTNKEGYKMMFRGPRTGRNNLRLVITDKVPSTGKVLRIN